MEDLILVILQALLEFVFETLLYLPFDLIPARGRTRSESERIAGACALWLIGGGLLSSASVTYFHRTFLHTPQLRIANLVAAPIASALLAQAFAKLRARSNPFVVPRNHFWQAFWFTFGLVAVRFVCATRT